MKIDQADQIMEANSTDPELGKRNEVNATR